MSTKGRVLITSTPNKLLEEHASPPISTLTQHSKERAIPEHHVTQSCVENDEVDSNENDSTAATVIDQSETGSNEVGNNTLLHV